MRQRFDNCFEIKQATYIAATVKYGEEYQRRLSSGIAESAIPPFTIKPPKQLGVLSLFHAKKIKPCFLGRKFSEENGPEGSEISRKLLAKICKWA